MARAASASLMSASVRYGASLRPTAAHLGNRTAALRSAGEMFDPDTPSCPPKYRALSGAAASRTAVSPACVNSACMLEPCTANCRNRCSVNG
eukprot:4304812-Amphidinium_carterae.1